MDIPIPNSWTNVNYRFSYAPATKPSKQSKGWPIWPIGLTGVVKCGYKEAGLMAGAVAGGLAQMIKAAVANAASYEQNRIAFFEWMLGSADKARGLLKQVSDFARKNPFELPQIVEGTKSLLAYKIAQKEVIPNFKMLGDIISGVGTETLPQLITAFGPVLDA